MPKGVDYTSGYDQIDQGDAQEITFASALDGQRFAGVTTAPALHDVRFTMTGLIIDAELSNDEWMSVLDTIEAVQSAHQWHYGDWLQYGVKRKYGQTGKQMEAITERTGKDYDTLQGYYNTARLFEFPMRIGNCSFEVHKVIAKAFPGDTQGDEKNRLGWLQVAATEKLGGRILHRRIYQLPDPVATTPFQRLVKNMEMDVDRYIFLDHDQRKLIADKLQEWVDRIRQGKPKHKK